MVVQDAAPGKIPEYSEFTLDDAVVRRPQWGRDEAAAAPAVRILDRAHERALKERASDLHIEPTRGGGRMRQRVDGMLVETERLEADQFTQVQSRIKLLAGMDIADRRQPQDGRYSIDLLGRSIDARVSSVPTIAGEKLVIRFLDNSGGVSGLDCLGIPADILSKMRDGLAEPSGFFVACGPTGSGKTTTLYAALAERNRLFENVCSVEDPVEIAIPGVSQVQVNPRAGLSFASALRSFLRQDPNVIMVGEIRDTETAEVAMSTAQSGQLVLTTLHSADAAGSFERFAGLGIDRISIAATLTGVVSQRLLRKLCQHCCFADGIDPGLAAGGCDDCGATGYNGRTGVFEFLPVDETIRDLISAGVSGNTILRRSATFRPMLQDAWLKVQAGVTSAAEVRRALGAGLV